MNHQTTTDDRQHFCTYEEAIAAIPDALPFRSNGCQHVAVNLSTGHRLPCADAYMASGYVAGSAAMFSRWVYVLEMGDTRIPAFPAHPLLKARLQNRRWQVEEEAARQDRARAADRQFRAQAAYDAVMASDDEQNDA